MDRIEQNIVVFGCGAMALETCGYIQDMNATRTADQPHLVVSDVVSPEFSRIAHMEAILGHPVAQRDTISEVQDFEHKKSVIGIGSPQAVDKISNAIRENGGSFVSVMHPSSYVSPHATVEAGVIIAPFAFVGPFASIGKNAIINVRATIGHDVTVGQGAIVSPHVDINGGATIGKYAFLGAGAIIDPTVEIGNFCKVSSGLAIRKKMPAGHFAFGEHSKTMKMFHPETGRSLFRSATDST